MEKVFLLATDVERKERTLQASSNTFWNRLELGNHHRSMSITPHQILFACRHVQYHFCELFFMSWKKGLIWTVKLHFRAAVWICSARLENNIHKMSVKHYITWNPGDQQTGQILQGCYKFLTCSLIFWALWKKIPTFHCRLRRRGTECMPPAFDVSTNKRSQLCT